MNKKTGIKKELSPHRKRYNCLTIFKASILPGSQECKGILALLAKAPPNKKSEIKVIEVSLIKGIKLNISE
jgi:hypothetical protein